jgi:hypothetical protein
MYRCPTCVSLLSDATVRRCPVCNENFKRHEPVILGADRRGSTMMTSWDIRARADASKILAEKAARNAAVDVDLPREHLRDNSGRTAAAERG